MPCATFVMAAHSQHADDQRASGYFLGAGHEPAGPTQGVTLMAVRINPSALSPVRAVVTELVVAHWLNREGDDLIVFGGRGAGYGAAQVGRHDNTSSTGGSDQAGLPPSRQ